MLMTVLLWYHLKFWQLEEFSADANRVETSIVSKATADTTSEHYKRITQSPGVGNPAKLDKGN